MTTPNYKKPIEITLFRFYNKLGTNGKIIYRDWVLHDTIELPWRENQRNISCIPEGRYRLTLYPSKKFGMRLLINNVKGRDGILIHPANDAAKELQGCVAPVTTAIGFGRGSISLFATNQFQDMVTGMINQGYQIYLTITSDFGVPT